MRGKNRIVQIFIRLQMLIVLFLY